ncbi:MAG: pdxH [Acidimicrobiia bacterium]|nr:pdxH [Acidimicrobiia bacterium]
MVMAAPGGPAGATGGAATEPLVADGGVEATADPLAARPNGGGDEVEPALDPPPLQAASRAIAETAAHRAHWLPMGLADRRDDYDSMGIDLSEMAESPIAQWWRWYDDAVAAKVPEPNAMTVATVDDHGAPDARVVLARGVDEAGFAFYTNFESAKSRQLIAHPQAAAVFAWIPLHRQVRARGAVERVSDADADHYFDSRPRPSQLAAWVSRQSDVIADRATLERDYAQLEQRFAGGPVSRPPFWGGWRLVPREVEFWHQRGNRLHDRLRYRRSEDGWSIERLAP